MDIRRKPAGKKFWIPVVFVGIVILFVTIACLSGMCKKQAEENLLKTVNYMKVQCAAYSNYNNGAETQALLRAVESNRQVRNAIAESSAAGGELTEEMLEQYAGQLWLHGILVLDSDGNKVCGYAKNEDVEQKLLENYSRKCHCTGIEGECRQ